MRIADDMDVKLCVYDIETIRGVFDIGIYDPDTKQWIEFEISAYKNDLYKFVKYYSENDKFDYWVSFNGIGFDHPVLEYIVHNAPKWFDLTGHEIAQLIAAYGSKIIEDQNYGIFPIYKESNFHVKPIDVFKIHHMDNEAKRTSLKWCEFMMNMNVEEMPIHHETVDLSQEDIQMIKDYRKNDVMATLALLYVTIGEPDKIATINGGFPVEELNDYRDNNKIQQRMDIEKQEHMPCLNWSDVKIGEEMNKIKYMQAMGIKNEYDLQPKKVKHPFGQRFKNFFPKTMDFKTKQLQDFVEDFGSQYVLAAKQEFPIKIGETTYNIAKGGIHSTESNRRIIPIEGWNLEDADVGAQYPSSIIKLGIAPPHLDMLILEQFKETVQLKDVYKGKGKVAKKDGDMALVRSFKSFEGLTKLQMNGGYYGKLGQTGSFLEYPEGLLKVCIGNQIEILMLIESLEMNDFKVVSGNTDGILTYYPASRQEEYKRLCKEWEEKVGNLVLGKLEYATFAGLWQESVNSYLGKETNTVDETGSTVKGKIKKKGRFVTSYGLPGCELNKNKSKRIIPLALEAYFLYGKNPIDFIKNHTNIFDFCVAKKAAGRLYYEELGGRIHNRIIRYYVTNKGSILKKRGINQFGDPMDNHCEAADKDFFWMGQPEIKCFNEAKLEDDFKKYDVNYSYYIIQTLKRIDAIEKTKKAKLYTDSFKALQTSLF